MVTPPEDGGPGAVDVEAAERGVDRRPDLGLVGLQVVAGDEAAMLLHVPGDQLGGPARVELVGAARGDPLERGGEVGLDEPVAGLPGRAVGLAQRGDRLGIVAQPAEVARGPRDVGGTGSGSRRPRPSWRLSDAGEVLGDREALARQADRRPDELGPGPFAPSGVCQAPGRGRCPARRPPRPRSGIGGRGLPSGPRYIVGVADRGAVSRKLTVTTSLRSGR